MTSKVSRVGTGRLESPCSMFGPHYEKLNPMFENVFNLARLKFMRSPRQGKACLELDLKTLLDGPDGSIY